jgi:RimJ/RimL family protein N-acetyltransferase
VHPEDLKLTTARLLLRPIRLEDFDPWAQMMTDEEAARFIGGRQPRSVAWRGFMCSAGAWHLTGIAMFSVIEKSSGRWIGRVGPWRPEGWPGPEIGWAISREFWGRGYATEAASASIDWAFNTLGWNEVIHSISPENVSSQSVARKLGSHYKGPGRLPAPFEDTQIDIWGQSRDDWYARVARPKS